MSTTKLPGSPRYRALLQVLRTAEELWNASRLFFARWDLSPSQFNVLNLLHLHPDGFTQSELGRQLIMHRSNVTGLVDRLEKRNLVQRKETSDRRAYRVVLTKTGQKLVAQILPVYYEAAEAIWGSLPEKRTRQLVSDLEKLGSQIDEFSKINPD